MISKPMTSGSPSWIRTKMNIKLIIAIYFKSLTILMLTKLTLISLEIWIRLISKIMNDIYEILNKDLQNNIQA